MVDFSRVEMIDKTIYANVSVVKTSGAELVLEFGTNFPSVPGEALPPTYQPDIRVVVPVGLLGGLTDTFSKMQKDLGKPQDKALDSQKKA